jgi:hypothetical protein
MRCVLRSWSAEVFLHGGVQSWVMLANIAGSFGCVDDLCA